MTQTKLTLHYFSEAKDAELQVFLSENGLSSWLDEDFEGESPDQYEAVRSTRSSPISPQLRDLCRLFWLVRKRRVTTILEFGTGYSTLMLAQALQMNEHDYGDFVLKHLRRSKPFSLFVVDDDQKWLEVSRSRVPEDLRPRITFLYSETRMTTFQERICTEYAELPNVCPDFIYLDGPSQFNTQGAVAGIHPRDADRVPMSCDVLKIEHYLLPGTFILVDGRTANARFLQCNLQRNWVHHFDPEGDFHTFELVEQPLGRFNKRQLDFCLNGEVNVS